LKLVGEEKARSTCRFATSSVLLPIAHPNTLTHHRKTSPLLIDSNAIAINISSRE